MPPPSPSPLVRLRAVIRGTVQGVGFRPFVFRLARELGLKGWVSNTPAGVFLEVEGPALAVEQFLLRLETGKPPHSFIQSLEPTWLDPAGYPDFTIRPSAAAGAPTALVLPDIATCPECVREIFDPANRRYRYPFTNCTHCGPRFSIITALPYDRAHTTMAGFTMCPACRAEYENPHDRRFHAQPNACPDCGPTLEFWVPAAAGPAATDAPASAPVRRVGRADAALRAAAAALRAGRIVALKGLGGFQLLVDARSEAAVQRLRARKHREEKPFALMFPTLADVQAVCDVSPLEARLLRSPEAPIVLLPRRPLPPTDEASPRRPQPSEFPSVGTGHRLAASIAPGNPNLGVMLPYTPLHYLLLAELGFPVVATSGNRSDEPICTDEHEAVERLTGIADAWLVHNRPIARHVDDSVVRVVLGRELVLRRARGYAPLPITLPSGRGAQNSEIVLAVGAHLKNTVALAVDAQVFLSQHIGDLETEPAYAAFQRVIADFQTLYQAEPGTIVSDLHPDYLSTRYAEQRAADTRPPHVLSPAGSAPAPARHVRVQHHLAHVLACMAENEIAPPALGVAWDGTGYGLDGTVWGGEFFLVTDQRADHVAQFRPFPLPGGEAAVKEPRRTALGLLYAAAPSLDRFRDWARRTVGRHFSSAELAALETMLPRRVNAPLCGSVGRLFDAVASLAGLRQRVRFEGQAAMELEFALAGVETDAAYPLAMRAPDDGRPGPPGLGNGKILLDWGPMLEALLADVEGGASVSDISARFHNALVEVLVAVARRVGQPRVVLSGGCFQNRYVTERAVHRLRAAGFQPVWHQRVPPNDGGIALGQVWAVRCGGVATANGAGRT